MGGLVGRLRSPYSAAQWWRKRLKGRLEPAVIDLFCKRGATVVDVGASNGVLTNGMRRRVGPHGQVLALEPNPYQFRLLSAALGAYRNVTLLDKAAADETGDAVLRIPTVAGHRQDGLASLAHTDGDAVTVATVRLDELGLTGNIGFVKIDVEGFERQVLDGAKGVLWRVESLMVEIEERHQPDGQTIDSTFALLDDAGLIGYGVFPDGLRPVAEFDVNVHQRGFTPNENGSMGPKYVNNFVFVRPGDRRPMLLAPGRWRTRLHG